MRSAGLLVLWAAVVMVPPAAAAPAAGALQLPAAGRVVAVTVVARERPDPAARAVHVFHDFRKDFRLQIVYALHERTGTDGKPWLHVELPMRPNGELGWIPAASAELKPVTTIVVVHRRARHLEVHRRGRSAFATIVAVGKRGAETPLGSYYVTARFTPTDPFYGPFALETSAYSRLSDWPGGGIVGIHGTSKPWLLGQAVSHGCVRVANSAALTLKQLVPVGSRIEILP